MTTQDDSKKPPLQLEIPWDQPLDKAMVLAEITNPDVFELAVSSEPGHDGLVVLFPNEHHGILFRNAALAKLMFQFDIILHQLLPFDRAEASGEGPAATKKKVTLH